MITTFFQIPIGARFEFGGRAYQKDALAMASDERGWGNIFTDEHEVNWLCKEGELPGPPKPPRPHWTSYMRPAPRDRALRPDDRTMPVGFCALPVGSRFEFRGRRYEKVNAEIGRDEDRGGNVFHPRTEVLVVRKELERRWEGQRPLSKKDNGTTWHPPQRARQGRNGSVGDSNSSPSRRPSPRRNDSVGKTSSPSPLPSPPRRGGIFGSLVSEKPVRPVWYPRRKITRGRLGRLPGRELRKRGTLK